MKKKFKDIQNSDLPFIETERFQEWKESGITFRRNEVRYGIITFFGTWLILQLMFQAQVFLGILPAILAFFFGRYIAEEKYFRISKQLGINENIVKRIRAGETIEQKDLKIVSIIETDNMGNNVITSIILLLFFCCGMYAIYDLFIR